LPFNDLGVENSPVMGEFFFFASASSVQRLRQAQHDNFGFFLFFYFEGLNTDLMD